MAIGFQRFSVELREEVGMGVYSMAACHGWKMLLVLSVMLRKRLGRSSSLGESPLVLAMLERISGSGGKCIMQGGTAQRGDFG